MKENFDLSPIDFADEVIQISVNFRGKKLMLVEANEDGAAAFRSAAARSQKIGDEGRSVTLDGIGELQAVLLAHCLKEVIEDKNGAQSLRPVSQAYVRSLPSRFARPLFERAKEISCLSEFAQSVESIDKQIAILQRQRAALEQAKNSRGAAQTNSEQPVTSGCSEASTPDGRLTASTSP